MMSTTDQVLQDDEFSAAVADLKSSILPLNDRSSAKVSLTCCEVSLLSILDPSSFLKERRKKDE
jgi:hypothetical protein